MKSEYCPLPDDYIKYPDRDINLIGTALRDRAIELTGIREIGALDTYADWIPIVQTIVDPGARTFLHQDIQLDKEPNGPKLWGPPSTSEYDYHQALYYMQRCPSPGTAQSWFPVQNELELLRGYLAQTALSTSEDPIRNQQLELFRRYLGAHAGLYYFLQHEDEGRVNIPQPFTFGPRFMKHDWKRHLVVQLEPDRRKAMEKAKHWGEPRPGEIDLGPLGDTEITVVAGGLETIAVAADFARRMPGVRLNLIDTNVVGRHALRQFVACLKSQNIRVAESTEEIQAAFDRSHGLFISDVLSDDPYIYDARVQQHDDPEKAVSSVNIGGLLMHAASRMAYGSPIVIQERTEGVNIEQLRVSSAQLLIDPKGGQTAAREEEIQAVATEEEVPQIGVLIADPESQIVPLLVQVNGTIEDDFTHVDENGRFRITAVMGQFPDTIELNDVDYIQYSNQLAPEGENDPVAIVRKIEAMKAQEAAERAAQTQQIAEVPSQDEVPLSSEDVLPSPDEVPTPTAEVLVDGEVSPIVEEPPGEVVASEAELPAELPADEEGAAAEGKKRQERGVKPTARATGQSATNGGTVKVPRGQREQPSGQGSSGRQSSSTRRGRG